MSKSPIADANAVDDPVEDQIGECLNLSKPKSFFLFAGAGSGKTRSLVKALKRVREESGDRLRLKGQRVAVITYTNAACDEIKHRLNFDPLIQVSTIHSFVWALINGFNLDIKQWVKENLKKDIADLIEQEKKGRPGTKAAQDRAISIESKRKRLERLDEIKRFTYNPNGDNRGRDSLNHSEVIQIGAEFLTRKRLMKEILINKFPILLIDESQDTNKLLMEAFLGVQEQYKNRFSLGLIGDTMQRIYTDGKMDLGKKLPQDWALPVKIMNHRCPGRVVALINKIRSAVDNQQQQARTDKDQGFVHLFILRSDKADKQDAERKIAQRMASITGDEKWTGRGAEIKSLILEHHMAARRMGFLEMFEPLYKVDRLKTGLLDGSLPGLRVFSQFVLPLRNAALIGDKFAVAAIVRKFSPLLNRATLKAAGPSQVRQLEKVRSATEKLMALWHDNGKPSFLAVLLCVAESKLFEISEELGAIASSEKDGVLNVSGKALSETPDSDANEVLDAWRKFLQTPFSQIEPYDDYMNQKAAFDTHQGVKGREFPRVFVVMDDTEARGFQFSYEKLFGVKEKTKIDLENESTGKETSSDRTRRLFYVTCSRAIASLALVAYSDDPEKIRDRVIRDGWFKSDEVEIMD